MYKDAQENIEMAGNYLETYFPKIQLSDEELEKQLASKDILLDPVRILPYLQSALFDEKVIEMNVDNNRTTYIARLWDYPDEVNQDEDEEKDPRQFGEYLQKQDYIVSLPVEPGMGNLCLRRSSKVVLRMYTVDKTVELGAQFDSIVQVGGVSMLRLTYPVIGRVIREDRAFRARVPETFPLMVRVAAGKKFPGFTGKVKNINPTGIGFVVPRELCREIQVDDKIIGNLLLKDESLVNIVGRVKHITKMRTDSGREYTCGVDLRFSTVVSASKVERLVAQVQREHMREIVKKSNDCGVHLII